MVAYHLSRLVNMEITEQGREVLEEILDDNLLMVQEISWFSDLENYKAIGLILEYLNW